MADRLFSRAIACTTSPDLPWPHAPPGGAPMQCRLRPEAPHVGRLQPCWDESCHAGFPLCCCCCCCCSRLGPPARPPSLLPGSQQSCASLCSHQQTSPMPSLTVLAPPSTTSSNYCPAAAAPATTTATTIPGADRQQAAPPSPAAAVVVSPQGEGAPLEGQQRVLVRLARRQVPQEGPAGGEGGRRPLQMRSR